MDPAALRMKNFIQPDKFPYQSVLGWEYDSGNYPAALKKAMDVIGYDALRKEQAEKLKKGELMGIGICSFTEVVGAGPSKNFDILGIKMFDSAEIRVHPTGKAMARFGTKSQGQGHETTYAQIVAQELGIPASDIQVEEGDTDTAPYGLGTYASRSTPTSGAAASLAARKIRNKAKAIAAPSARVRRGGSRLGAGQVLHQGRARQGEDPSRSARSRRTPTCRRAWSPAWKPRTTTIRPTSPSRSAATSAWSTSTAVQER
jgi:CO/xanthine dehydrogenase Mo-binding subunit